MCGIGPFITIPLVVATIGGPQAVIGWVAGAVLALADGLVWAELGSAMPGAGGTYLYLREAFQYRTGRLMPFLFVWTAVLFIPLIMSTGVIGLVQYLAVALRDRLLACLARLSIAGPGKDVTITSPSSEAAGTGVELAGTVAELRDIALAAAFPEIDPAPVQIRLIE